MILKAAPISIECSQQPFTAQGTKCFLGSFSVMNRTRRDRSLINCKLLRSQIVDKKYFPKPHGVRRYFSGGFDVKKCFTTKPYAMGRSRSENFYESFFDQDALDDAKENGDLHSISKMIRSQGLDLFLQSSVDILDPIALGIRPEAPNWPEREAIRSIRLEQKAKSFTLPCSLRMVREKRQFHKGFNVLEESASCSLRKALSSTVFIMLELQISVLKMKESLCPEDLEMVLNKLQNDMQFSYAKLFQQVFSRTPSLMIYIILLLANFSLHSTSLNMTVAQAPLLLTCESDTTLCEKEDSLQQGNLEFQSVAEVLLWNSMANEATKMQADEGNAVLDHEELQSFVTPISAVPEADDYLDHASIETRYQIGLTLEPNNPLLLRNYAKFLLLVNDPDRAEECFKKAVQVIPPDAESHCLYAEFLWKVRNDLWGAELRYLEAIAVEPENHNIIAKYAEFLWNTGAEDTCFPLNYSN